MLARTMALLLASAPLFLISKFAPCSTRRRVVSIRPRAAASCSGVHPSAVNNETRLALAVQCAAAAIAAERPTHCRALVCLGEVGARAVVLMV
jgi:hypothetical protein